MVRLLNFSISMLVLTLFVGCKNKFRYPKDLKTGIYEVTATYNYPNDSNVTEVFNYFGPQKNQSSLIFTYSGNGYAKSFSIREVKGDPSTITFQVTDLNSNNFSIINCSFETIINGQTKYPKMAKRLAQKTKKRSEVNLLRFLLKSN